MVPTISRRDVLGGFGSLAMAIMLREQAEADSGGVLTALHHPAKAKRVVQLFMGGAASHLDLFDYKPALEKHHGEASDFGEHVEAFQDGLGPWMKSPWAFKPHGASGKYLSEIVEPLGRCPDESIR